MINKKQVQEINAGSMADIAFLLLIFFLVTTTMETEEGIARQLPQKQEKKTIQEVSRRNVLEISINGKNEILAGGELIDPARLYAITREFYTNPSSKQDLPELILLDEERCRRKIAGAKAVPDLGGEQQKWESALRQVRKSGSFRILPDDAFISLQHDNATSYAVYVQVQNEIQQAVNDLRNEWSLKLYNRNYSEMEKDISGNKEKIAFIRMLVPQRLAEQEPKNIAPY